MVNFVAFTGSMESGKSTAARWLCEKHGFAPISFATPIKRMLAELGVEGDKKQRHDALAGHTYRHALKTLGTEWGRKLLGEDVWLWHFEREFERLRRAGCARVVCDDVRYDNEAHLVRRLGGVVVNITRKGERPADSHSSEAGIGLDLIDHHIYNYTDTPNELGTSVVDSLLRELNGAGQ